MTDGSRIKATMAEAKGSGEIEDILSSIRRLVSEDLRPALRRADAAPLRAEPAVADDKLMLTPALRVRPAVQPNAETVVRPPSVLPRLHLEAASAVAQPGSGRVAGPPRSAMSQTLPPKTEAGDPSAEIDSLDWSSFTFARRPPHQTWAAPERSRDAPAAEDRTGTWPDAALLAGSGAEPTQGDTVAAVVAGPAQEDDNIFSEQVLRELVHDLMREQLQGDLGERITRNIRKLVKAEIARALDLRALD